MNNLCLYYDVLKVINNNIDFKDTQGFRLASTITRKIYNERLEKFEEDTIDYLIECVKRGDDKLLNLFINRGYKPKFKILKIAILNGNVNVTKKLLPLYSSNCKIIKDILLRSLVNYANIDIFIIVSEFLYEKCKNPIHSKELLIHNYKNPNSIVESLFSLFLVYICGPDKDFIAESRNYGEFITFFIKNMGNYHIENIKINYVERIFSFCEKQNVLYWLNWYQNNKNLLNNFGIVLDKPNKNPNPTPNDYYSYELINITNKSDNKNVLKNWLINHDYKFYNYNDRIVIYS